MDSVDLGNPSSLKLSAESGEHSSGGPCSICSHCHHPPHHLLVPMAGALALLEGLGQESLLNSQWMLRLQAGR